MKKGNLLLTTVFLAGAMTVPLASADTVLGVYVGAGVWQADLSGDIGVDSISFSDLGAGEEDANYFYVALEHPVPVIPNIRLQKMDLSYSQTGVISQSFQLDDQTFTASDTIFSDIDLSHTDITLYYELLDNWVSLDLGLTARVFDGSIFAQSVASPAIAERVDLEATLPMLYLKTQFDLPFSGFYITAGGNAIGYDGHSLTDLSAGVGYQSDGLALDFGVEIGLRQFSIELDDLDDELNTNVDIDGMYMAATIHF